ncbi:hypothetical protein B0H14DRAFT_2595881 [Mycena olivaceomarginata]|nr:hypothetical protein B0H14DRAFT_2595881 [Mycena olivaceomarginata]
MSDTCSWRRRNETYLPRSSSDDFVLREESVADRWPAANAPDPDAPAGLQSDGCFGAGVRGGPLGGREPAPPALGVHVHDVLAELRSADPHPLQEAEAAQVAAADLALPSLDAVAEPPLADLPQLLEADVLEPNPCSVRSNCGGGRRLKARRTGSLLRNSISDHGILNRIKDEPVAQAFEMSMHLGLEMSGVDFHPPVVEAPVFGADSESLEARADVRGPHLASPSAASQETVSLNATELTHRPFSGCLCRGELCGWGTFVGRGITEPWRCSEPLERVSGGGEQERRKARRTGEWAWRPVSGFKQDSHEKTHCILNSKSNNARSHSTTRGRIDADTGERKRGADRFFSLADVTWVTHQKVVGYPQSKFHPRVAAHKQ